MRLWAIIFSLCCSYSRAGAAYEPNEMFTILWGDSSNQLKISMPYYEDVNGTPSDSTDDWIEFSGPKMGVVDRQDNISFASYFFMQLKGFDRTGRLIFDCSENTTRYNQGIFKSGIANIFIDSLSRIYVVDGSHFDYIAVIDTACNIIDMISPHGIGSGIVVYGFSPGAADKLSIFCKDGTNYLYSDGAISAGAGAGWLSGDGYYYYSTLVDSSQIRFTKYHNPDITGTGTDIQEIYKPLEKHEYYYSEFLGVDDSMNLYVYLVGPTPAESRILIYDISFNYTTEIDFPLDYNKFGWYITPYMRPSDGNIYEFRCLDDGLHVIRWSKQ